MPLCRLRAATKLPHSCPFWASSWTVPQVWLRVLSSSSTVRRQVFLGCPRFRFPSGVQWRSVWRRFLAPFSSHVPSHDDGAHAVSAVASGEKMLVGDGLGPEYSWCGRCGKKCVLITKYTMVSLRICLNLTARTNNGIRWVQNTGKTLLGGPEACFLGKFFFYWNL